MSGDYFEDVNSRHISYDIDAHLNMLITREEPSFTLLNVKYGECFDSTMVISLIAVNLASERYYKIK